MISGTISQDGRVWTPEVIELVEDKGVAIIFPFPGTNNITAAENNHLFRRQLN